MYNISTGWAKSQCAKVQSLSAQIVPIKLRMGILIVGNRYVGFNTQGR